MPVLDAHAAALLAAAATLPGTLELAFLTAGALLRRRKPLPDPARPLRLCALVPAHDEEAGVARTVASLRACTGAFSSLDVLVVADHCTDATAKVAAAAGARVLPRSGGPRGKAAALGDGLASVWREGHDGYLVVDADSVVDPGFADEAARAFAAGADAVQARDEVANPEAGWRTALMSAAFMAINGLRAAGRDGWGLSCGIFGNGFGVSRETAQALPFKGGALAEDLEYHAALVLSGRRCRYIPAVAARAQMTCDAGASRAQRGRWEGGRLRAALTWWPRLAAGGLFLGPRVLEPLLDMLTLPLGFHVLLLRAAMAGGGAAAAAGAAGAAVVGVYAAAALVLGGAGRREFAALAFAPVYIAWKLLTIPAVLWSARRRSEWRRTERQEVPEPGLPVPLVLLGVPFHPVTQAQALEILLDAAQEGHAMQVATPNVDFAALADKNAALDSVLREADLVVADGMPLVWASRLLGPALPERVTGSDLTPELLKEAGRLGLGAYALGGAAGVAAKAMSLALRTSPGLRVCGTHSPERSEIAQGGAASAELVRRAAPEVLLVALGCPGQELWISRHLRSLPPCVALGIGGTLDFMAGVQPRAPRVLGRLGVEWVWRALSAPRRLGPRYAKDIVFFARMAARLAAIRLSPDRPCEEGYEAGSIIVPRMKSQLDARRFLLEAARAGGELRLDVGARSWLDSLELGAVLIAVRAARRRGLRVRLVRAGSRVRALLSLYRLEAPFGLDAETAPAAPREASYAV